jgi:hypothetical protein
MLFSKEKVKAFNQNHKKKIVKCECSDNNFNFTEPVEKNCLEKIVKHTFFLYLATPRRINILFYYLKQAMSNKHGQLFQSNCSTAADDRCAARNS